ncbi:ATP-binding protein [Gloeobacter kilaueensis]|uniref:histidine kinase n=1 Tax=Gloeobacter kilaueensis (strain ATCC BAA-2537 / CCAP 1431/1 / ULC 316 / JS1) TaxID=1183438 RepID=U5QFE0_GLOK1|nr:ATP-binding protein [Gloeobacter kilaueensis]AGY56385.1 multi-sensor hybrid histidine kinase [Gloeobacter kilaueensis JS1]
MNLPDKSASGSRVGVGNVQLKDVLITDQLAQRPSRLPDWQAENRALKALAAQLAAAPERILHSLVEWGFKLCGPGTVGVSLLEEQTDGNLIFRWVAVAGELASLEGRSTPGRFSPCGITLERGTPQLFAYPGRYFSRLQVPGHPIVEGLVVPLGGAGRRLGTIWIASHQESHRFDNEDVRLMTSLADFAAAALLQSENRRDAEQAALLRSGQFYRSILESSPDCIEVLDSRGTIVYINENSVRMMELATPGQIIGTNWLSLWRAKDGDLARRALAVARTGGVGRFSSYRSGARGTVRWWEVVVTLIPAAAEQPVRLLCTLRDASVHRRYEDAIVALNRNLYHRLNELQTLFEVLPAGLAVSEDPGCQPIRINLALASMLQLPQEADLVFNEQPSPPYQLYLENGEAVNLQTILRQAVDRETLSDFKVEVRCDNGTCLHLLGNAAVLTDEVGCKRGALLTLLDITQLTQVLAERQRLLGQARAAQVVAEMAQAEAEIAQGEAETANQIKEDFLAVLSHELRTPLNPIVGWTQLLRRGTLSSEQQVLALETIERNAKLQNELISSLLDASRIERDKFEYKFQPLDPAVTVRTAIAAVAVLAEQAKVELVVSIAEVLPAIKADPTRLTQVVWNLLTNAIKFTPSGGQVEIQLEASAQLVRLVVRDNGIGIAAAFLPHIFERFRQADTSRTRRSGGLGLGLFIVRRIVEAHGGQVRAESKGEGRGSTFTVELPLYQEN